MQKQHGYAMFILLLVVSALLGPPRGQAQSRPEFGLLGGINFSSLSWDLDRDADPRHSLRLGAFLALGSGGSFTFVPEVWYSNKGAVSEYEDYQGTTKATIMMERLEINALGQYMTWMGVTSRYRLYAGLQMSMPLSTMASFLTEGNTDAETQSGPDDDEVTGSTFGLVIGMGCDFPVFRDVRLRIDARYELGMSSYLTETTWKDRTLSFIMGVSI